MGKTMSVKKYRKRPVVIEAIQWTLGNDAEVFAFIGQPDRVSVDGAITIETLEGTMLCMPNDWVIKGVKGEFYPCKPDIFDVTYEETEWPA